jgi:hypothetical protein
MDDIKSETINIATAVGDFLTGVPVIGTAVSAGKVYRAYNEKLFREKLESFLKEVNPSPETKEKFAQAVKGDQSSFSKKLWTILDKLEDNEKATMAGKLFNKVLNGNLKIDEFLEATDTIQKMYIGHLASLRKEHMIGDNKAASNQQHRFHLIQHGLLIESDQPARSENHLRKAQLSPLGKIITMVVN